MDSIRAKLVFGFGLILSVLLVHSGIAYLLSARSDALVERAISHDFQASLAVSRIAVAGNALRRFEKELFVYADEPVKRAKYFVEWEAAYKQLEQMLQVILKDRSGMWSDSDRAEIGRWSEALADYGRGFRDIAASLDRGSLRGTMAANEAIQAAKDRFRVLLDGADQVAMARFSAAQTSAAVIQENFKTINLVRAGTSLIAVAIAVALLSVVLRGVSQPIESLTEAAHRMSTGDLNRPVPPAPGKEFRSLSETLERLRVSQKLLLDRLRTRSA